jgi:transcriptional regulator GlxA family with amidase domain
MAFTRVAAYAPPGVTALSLGTVSAIFMRRPGLPPFEFALCASRPGPLPTDLRLSLTVDHGLGLLATADLVLVLPGEDFRIERSAPLCEALRTAHNRGAIIASHCVGTFLLAATGLVDGREVATHWQFADELAAEFPEVTVRSDALYIDEGPAVTGAGASAGIDMCLHLFAGNMVRRSPTRSRVTS